jgi:hypothetical protein
VVLAATQKPPWEIWRLRSVQRRSWCAISPLTLIGSVSEVVHKLVANRERLGISYVVVFDTAIDDMTPVVQRLAGT